MRQTDVRSSDCSRSSILGHKLVGINPQLDDVVDDRNERSKWKCSDKQCHKTKLQHCNINTTASLINGPHSAVMYEINV